MTKAQILLEGFLMKKKRDDKKSLLSSKYQRRYFELTSDSLIYGKDASELRNGGHVLQVFYTSELEYVKRKQKVKLEIRFPDRLLRLKAETAEEAERWEVALQKANMIAVHGESEPQKVTNSGKSTTQPAPKMGPTGGGFDTHLTIEADSDDSDEAPSRGAPPARQKPTSSQQAPPPLVPWNIQPILAVRTNQLGKPEEETNKPPSPRSLLANPKLGLMMVSTPTQQDPIQRNSREGEFARGQEHDRGEDRRWSREDSESEEDGYRQQKGPQSLPQQRKMSGVRDDGFDEDRSHRSGSNIKPREEERLTLEPTVPAPNRLQAKQQQQMSRSESGDRARNGAPARAAAAERLILEDSGGSGGYGTGRSGSPGQLGSGNSPSQPRGRSLLRTSEDDQVIVLQQASSPSGRPPAGPRGSLPSSGRMAPSALGDGMTQGPRHTSKTASPVGPSPRGPSPVAQGRSQGNSRPESAATSGTGDENWVDSDWDSSDGEQNVGRQRGGGGNKPAATGSARQPPSPQPKVGPAVAAAASHFDKEEKKKKKEEEEEEENWDSDEEEEEPVRHQPSPGTSARSTPPRNAIPDGQTRQKAPASQVAAQKLPSPGSDEDLEEENPPLRVSRMSSGDGQVNQAQKDRFKRGPVAVPVVASEPARNNNPKENRNNDNKVSNTKPGGVSRKTGEDFDDDEPLEKKAGVNTDKDWLEDDWDEDEDDE